MASYIARQPNGLYCRFSTVVDCPTHWNMTQEDYLSNITGTVPTRDDGLDVLKNYVQLFARVLDETTDDNMTKEEFDQLLKVMSTRSM